MRKFKKFLVLLLTLSIVAPSLPLVPVHAAGTFWDGSIAEEYEAGTGTEEDPFRIKTGAQLAYMAQQVNSGQETGYSYMLTAGIFLASNDWTPIGTEQNPFIGTFDGKGHEILGLSVNSGEGATQISFQTDNAFAVAQAFANKSPADYVPYIADTYIDNSFHEEHKIRDKYEELVTNFPELGYINLNDLLRYGETSGAALAAARTTSGAALAYDVLSEINTYTERFINGEINNISLYARADGQKHANAGLFGYFKLPEKAS